MDITVKFLASWQFFAMAEITLYHSDLSLIFPKKDLYKFLSKAFYFHAVKDMKDTFLQYSILQTSWTVNISASK